MKLDKENIMFSILIILFISLPCNSDEIKMNKGPLNEISDWFEIKSVANKVWRINDHENDNVYLVEGDEKALLIDTGIGAADLAQCVKNIKRTRCMTSN